MGKQTDACVQGERRKRASKRERHKCCATQTNTLQQSTTTATTAHLSQYDRGVRQPWHPAGAQLLRQPLASRQRQCCCRCATSCMLLAMVLAQPAALLADHALSVCNCGLPHLIRVQPALLRNPHAIQAKANVSGQGGEHQQVYVAAACCKHCCMVRP